MEQKKENSKVTIDFKEAPAVLQWVRDEAEADDRSASVWLRRLILEAFHQRAQKGAA